MIQVDTAQSDQHAQIILYPHRPLNVKANRCLMYCIAGLTLAIAISFALQGAWLILPFAGGEIAILFYVMHRVLQSCHRMEIIRVESDSVTVEQGSAGPEKIWTCQRFFTRVIVQQPSHPWYPIRVFIRGRGSETEVGAFLNEDEKKQLIMQLRQSLPVT